MVVDTRSNLNVVVSLFMHEKRDKIGSYFAKNPSHVPKVEQGLDLGYC